MRIFLPLFLVFLLACEKNADVIQSDSCGESYTIYDTWSGITAIIEFDSTEGSYFLNHHIPGSIDGMITAYPCDLPSRFHSEGKRAIVSGNLFESDHLPTPYLGGQEILKIDIHQIEFLEDEG